MCVCVRTCASDINYALEGNHDAVLAAKPAGESQVKTNGMWLQLPSFGVIKGSTFTAVLYVNSQAAKSFALGTWQARITHSTFFTAVRVTSVKYDVVLGSKSATSFVLTSSLKSSFAGDSDSDKKHLISSKLQVAVAWFPSLQHRHQPPPLNHQPDRCQV